MIFTKNNKRGQMALVLLLLFGLSLIFYAVMFPELRNIIDEVKVKQTDETLILIYDILPFALGFMLILATILTIASIIR